MSKVYTAFKLLEDVVDYINQGGKCRRFQFFVSDPTRLRLLGAKQEDASLGQPLAVLIRREASFIREVLKDYKVQDVIIHGSYLIDDMSHPYQLYLLKQEVAIAAAIGANAYIIHAHSTFQLDLIHMFRLKYKDTLLKNLKLLVENTSRTIDQDDAGSYKRALLKHPLIIDTSHLYSSGIAETSEQMLGFIKKANQKKLLYGLHFNDQIGGFGQGHDKHCMIGKGRAFFQDPERFWDDADLYSFAALHTKAVVCEFPASDDYEYFFLVLQAFANKQIYFDKVRFLECADVLNSLLEFIPEDTPAAQFRRLHYQATAAQLKEVGEKEGNVRIDSRLWRMYKLNERIVGVLYFAAMLRHRSDQDSLYKGAPPRLKSSNESRISLKRALTIATDVCKELRVVKGKNAFICGSIRRECSLIGDIDILIITPQDRAKFISRIEHIIDESLDIERQRDPSPRYQIYESEQQPLIIRLVYQSMNIDVYFATEQQKATMMLFLTGSKFFNISMRMVAKRQGFKLSGYSLSKQDRAIKTPTESSIFNALGIPFVQPRYRSMWL